MTARPGPPAGGPAAERPAGDPAPPRPPGRAAGRRPYAVVVENERAGRAPGTSMAPPSRFEITARETIVGRDPSCAIRLDNLFVSRRHARLLLRGAALHLDDLASTNVTRRNGDPVHTRVQVHPGDVLHFASVRCRVVEAAPHPDDEAAGDEAAEPVEPAADRDSAPPEADGSAETAPAPVEAAEEAPEPLPAESRSPEFEGESGGVGESGDPAPAAEAAEPARPTPEEPGDDGRAGETGEGEGAGGEEPAAAPPEAAAEPVSPAGPVAPAEPVSPPGPIFVAGPLPGEPRRTRVRAVLWGLALAALAALAAVVLL